ncbi:hypothetical protein GCM10022392_30250 [Mucilaginibacter panaciglaebae]|uniref:Uncharacterized protein n=1 Tax=Mucilaginibacter panaciglaebae TaxID=502331 RepID=A0ABP7X2I1_9SPHI
MLLVEVPAVLDAVAGGVIDSLVHDEVENTSITDKSSIHDKLKFFTSGDFFNFISVV